MSPGKWRFVCTMLAMYHPSLSSTLFCELICNRSTNVIISNYFYLVVRNCISSSNLIVTVSFKVNFYWRFAYLHSSQPCTAVSTRFRFTSWHVLLYCCFSTFSIFVSLQSYLRSDSITTFTNGFLCMYVYEHQLAHVFYCPHNRMDINNNVLL